MKLLGLGILMALMITACGGKKTAFIKGQKVYDEFAFTKKKQKEFLNQRDQRNNVLDSLKNNIVQLENNLRLKTKRSDEEMNKYNQMVQLYRTQADQFEKENNSISTLYKEEILKLLVDYVQDFGKENGYTYVYGDWETGAIMYGNESEDVTDQVIEYINKKYKE